MEPEIRYARTSDGVSIACYAIGSGPVLVWTQFPFSHLQAERQNPDTRQTLETSARLATLVRYDPRGFGLSDRQVTSFTLDELASDLDAVDDRLRIERFVWIAGGASSPLALRWVASNPGRVTHLVLYPGFARTDGVAANHWEALAPMAVDDWDYVSGAMTRAAFGWESEESSRRDAELLRSSVTPETLIKYMGHVLSWDASPYVRDVSVPTLLLQQPEARYTSMEAMRRLLSELPNGRLVLVEGATAADRRAEILKAILDFVGRPARAEAPISEPDPASTAIILFADVVDSTAIAGQIGNAAFRKRTRQLEGALRALIRECGGAPVEGRTLGDGVIGVFKSAAQAIEAALQCRQPADNAELRLHLGIHAGDVIHESGNVSGVAVSIAARISDLTAPNEILVSGTVRDLARASTGVAFEDRGEHQLKGVADAVRVFAVRPDSG